MTPIQELLKKAESYPIELNCKLIPLVLIETFIQKEKEFAKQCFEAGQMDGLFPEKDFETFYKQFEK